MSCWALLALKPPGQGKSRLAGVLTPPARERLIDSMLERVVDTLHAAREVAAVAVVTRERRVLPPELLALPDAGLGLNGAVAAGARTLAALGARELLVLHPDLPLLAAGEVDAFVQRARACGVGLAPDRRGSGTNAVYLAPPEGFEFGFGPASFAHHLRQAQRRCAQPAIAHARGFAFDVDEPADLAALADEPGARSVLEFDPRSSTPWTPGPKTCSPWPAAQRG